MTQAIDKQLVRKRFRKRLGSYDRHADVQRRMAGRLVECVIAAGCGDALRVLEIGCGTGVLTRMILDRLDVRELFANDLVPECRDIVKGLTHAFPQTPLHFLEGDIEACTALPPDLDLIISNATLHWMEDFAALLPRLKGTLRSGGRLGFSIFGPCNLQEIRELTGSSLHYASEAAIVKLLHQHFRVVTSAEDVVTLSFSSPREVLAHLRYTGVNALRRERWTPRTLEDFDRRYRNGWEHGGAVPLTYHPMFFVAEAD